MTDMASKLGDVRAANMIAVGVLIKKIKMISVKHGQAALAYMLKEKEDLLAVNKKALEKGYGSAK